MKLTIIRNCLNAIKYDNMETGLIKPPLLSPLYRQEKAQQVRSNMKAMLYEFFYFNAIVLLGFLPPAHISHFCCQVLGGTFEIIVILLS